MSIKDLLNAASMDEQKQVKSREIVINDKKFLSERCEPATFSEAEEIWPILEASLGDSGFGITANQIGIRKAVCFIKFNNETYKLLNPRISESSVDTIIFAGEGCISFPKKTCNTVRRVSVVVEDDNLGRLDLSLDKNDILPIIFQHEIDHVNGRLIFDNVRKPFTKGDKKVGRNAPCPCHSGKKFKKCCG